MSFRTDSRLFDSAVLSLFIRPKGST